MIESKNIGNITEVECFLACMKAGLQISIPYGEDSRYDFVIDYHNKLYRIQCKHCSEVLDESEEVVAIKFKTVRQSGSCARHRKRTKYSKDEIDYFATYYNNKCYMVPVEQCSVLKILRIIPPKNNQIKGVSFLKDFELSEVLKTI